MHSDDVNKIAKGQVISKHVSQDMAIQRLGALNTMASTRRLVALLEDVRVAEKAYAELTQSIYLFNNFYQVVDQYRRGNLWAFRLLKSWARSEWLTRQPMLPESLVVSVFKAPFVMTAEMLSPMCQAFSRSNIGLHAESLLQQMMPKAITEMNQLKARGYPIAFVAPKIDTTNASSLHRQSAVQSLLFHIRGIDKIHSVSRGIVLSEHVDDGFYEIAESRGALVLAMDTRSLSTGDVITLKLYQKMVQLKQGQCLSFTPRRTDWQSVWRMGGLLECRLGRALTRRAQAYLNNENVSRDIIDNKIDKPYIPSYTLAQKIIANASTFKGVEPYTECEPVISAVAVSCFPPTQPNIERLSLHGSLSDLVVKEDGVNLSCYPGGLALQSRDGRLSAWFNRLLLPDTVHLSQDPHTRYPLGITLSPNSIEAPLASVTGVMPITLPESVLIRFYGRQHSHIRLRDLINAIPYFGLRNDSSGQDTRHMFSKRIVEIQGLDDITVPKAYEFTEDSTSYDSDACVIELSETRVIEALTQNKQWLEELIQDRYPNHDGLQRRLHDMCRYLEYPKRLKADANAKYSHSLEIALEEITEPLLACIEQLDLVLPLSEAGKQPITVDTVWIGSTAMDIDHYRVVATLLAKHQRPLKARLWIAPSSTIELKQLMKEGCYQIYSKAGVYTQMPESVLCADACFRSGSTIVATSGRSFLHHVRRGWNGYIASPELATITAILGRLPTLAEYQSLL